MTMFVAVTVDIDNDGLALSNERNRLSWRGLEKVPEIAETVHRAGLPATWFVRADPQLKMQYGAADYLLDHHADLWRGLRADGDEIAWHPHVTHVGAQNSHEPEHDDARYAAALRKTHAELTALGHQFTCARLGEAFGGNACIRTLADLGLRADSSAIPGRRRDDGARYFDWTGTPNHPYRPATDDYRTPGRPAVPILEVPMTVMPVHHPAEPHPLPRYVNLAYRPSIFSEALERWFQEITPTDETFLTTIVHPDELIAENPPHPLYAFTLDALRTNVAQLLAAAEKRKIDIVGLTVAAVERQVTGSVPA
jgi:peptidoglycan/xylan/chitin deacetylase (PgdA/CDA1 family)